jgi:putative transposase
MLTVVQPATLIRWHRKGCQLLWRWKSKPPGRPRIPADLRQLIGDMALANPTWGEERIATELLLKLGIRVSPRTVRRYLPSGGGSGTRRISQCWTTFVRNHARAVLACDFLVAVTVRFRLLYVFVVPDVGTRRIVHWNVTEHPTADWTQQQFRMVAPGDQPHRFLIHDRDSVFSPAIDEMLTSTGLTVLKTPVRSPRPNAHCERLIRTIRRECLDWLIPLSDWHLRRILQEWVTHYNRGRATRQPGARHSGSTVGADCRTVSSPSSSGGQSRLVEVDLGRAPSRVPTGTGGVKALSVSAHNICGSQRSMRSSATRIRRFAGCKK